MLSILSCVCWQSIYLLWRNVYLGLLPNFGLGWFFVFLFLILSCMSCLYILEINPLSVASFANIFCWRSPALLQTSPGWALCPAWGGTSIRRSSELGGLGPGDATNSLGNLKRINETPCASVSSPWKGIVTTASQGFCGNQIRPLVK